METRLKSQHVKGFSDNIPVQVVAVQFLEDIVKKACGRANGYCECTRFFHEHEGRCNRVLQDNKRGHKDTWYGWQAYSISGRYFQSISDCEILCWDCYSKSF